MVVYDIFIIFATVLNLTRIKLTRIILLGPQGAERNRHDSPE